MKNMSFVFFLIIDEILIVCNKKNIRDEFFVKLKKKIRIYLFLFIRKKYCRSLCI